MRNAYLFAWNSQKKKWPELQENINEAKTSGMVALPWSCASHRSVKLGDRAFLIKLGPGPRGLMGSGYISSLPFEDVNWKGKKIMRVMINFERLIDPYQNELLTPEILKENLPGGQLWSTQSSGIAIREQVLPELEPFWDDFLKNQQ